MNGRMITRELSGYERQIVAAEDGRVHGCEGVRVELSECSAAVISARASWKARVDSAPWFSLGRSVVEAVAAAARGGIVEGDAEVVAAEKPLEGPPGLAPPEVVARWRGRPQGRRPPWPAPRRVVGRNRRGRRFSRESHCCRSGGNGRSVISDFRPASAGFPSPLPGPAGGAASGRSGSAPG